MSHVNSIRKPGGIAALSVYKNTLLKSCLWLGLILALAAPASGADERPLKPSPKDKCPVCGMFVAKYPEWIAQIQFRGGSWVYFDGAKDFFKFYHDLKRYQPTRSREDLASMWVTDYYAVKLIEAARAFFVIGSDVYGPMGRELIPFEKEAEAKEFLKDHKGKAVYRFNQITPEIIRTLD
jgi:nitrous oxide reductase accessory protein NosL